MTKSQSENLQEFNRPSHDSLGLGRTPSHRSAEIVAGGRAEILGTPETMALSRYAGRFFAQLTQRLSGKSSLIEMFAARMVGVEALVKRHVAQDTSNLTLVDVASGFSPRALNMAKQFPQAEVIEIDLPDVLQEKVSRLKKSYIELPSNLKWIEADLGERSLSDILEGRKAHLITSEGLTLYLTPAELKHFFQQIYDSLTPDGIFITEMYFESKLVSIRQNPQTNTVMSMFLRQIGHVPGLVKDSDEATALLKDIGFQQVKDYQLDTLMDELGQTQIKPVDVVSLYVAHHAPTQPDQKSVPQDVINTVTPADTVTTSETVAPAETVTPMDTVKPVDTVKPADTVTPVDTATKSEDSSPNPE